MEVNIEERTAQIRQDRRNCYYGTFLIHLDALAHKTTDSDDKTEEESRIKRLLDIFRGEGCRNDESENRIAAVIERSVFMAALQISASSEHDHLQTRSLHRQLSLPPQARIDCLYGKSRIEAARRFFDPMDRYWLVDLYSEQLHPTTRRELEEQYHNEAVYSDGKIVSQYRFYQDEHKEIDADRWLYRLLEYKQRRLKALARHKQIYDAVCAILSIPGQQFGLRLSVVYNMLATKADEIIHYLNLISDTGREICGNRHDILRKMDRPTVEAIQGRAPGICSSDMSFIEAAIKAGSCFSSVTREPDRVFLLNNLATIRRRIPSLYTFFEDLPMLAIYATIVKRLLPDPIETSINTALRSIFRSETPNHVFIQVADDRLQLRQCDPASQELLVIAQLWLLAARNFVNLSGEDPRRDRGQELTVQGCRCFRAWRSFAQLAKSLGFQSTQIELLREEPERSHVCSINDDSEQFAAEWTTSLPEELHRRYGKPSESSYIYLRKTLFVDSFHIGTDKNQNVTRFFTGASQMEAILGSIPQAGPPVAGQSKTISQPYCERTHLANHEHLGDGGEMDVDTPQIQLIREALAFEVQQLKEDRATAHKTIASLQARLDMYESNLENARQHLVSYRNTCEQQTREIKLLKRTGSSALLLPDRVTKTKATSGEIQGLKEALDLANQRSYQSRYVGTELTLEQLSAAEDKYRHAEHEHKTMKIHLEDARTEIESLTVKLTEANAEIEYSKNLPAPASQKCYESRGIETDLTLCDLGIAEEKALTTELQSWKSQYQALCANLSEAQSSLKNSGQEIDDAKKAIARDAEENAALQQKIIVLQQQNTVITERCSTEAAKAHNLSEQHQICQKNLSVLEAEKSRLQLQNAELNRSDAAYQDTDQKNQDTISELSQKHDSILAQLKSATDKQEKYSQVNAHLTSRIKDLQEQHENLETNIAANHQRETELQQQLQSARQAQKNLADQNALLTEELKNVKKKPEKDADDSVRLHLHTWDDKSIERTSCEDIASSHFAEKISELYRKSYLVCVVPKGRAFSKEQAYNSFIKGNREFHGYEQRRGRNKKRKPDPDLQYRDS